MNNLLRTLTASNIKPAGDLRLLLTTVKDGRRQSHENNNKLTDPFYDSLEGLLVDLKTITIDNRDAEAFLKPVSKAEVPDYYDVIQNPMDFQTMLKKVKQKTYKSKREFKDDLDLIWSNCLTYNAAENHPLRPCVRRLKVKAERLLQHITDRKERTDPPIPSDLPTATGVARPRLNGSNGHLNGHSSHTRSPSITLPPKTTTITLPAKSRRDIHFPEMPAIVRTPEGMAMFLDFDREVGSSKPRGAIAHTLRELVPPVEADIDADDARSLFDDTTSVGEKRKLNATDQRPKKKARFGMHYATPLPGPDGQDELSQLWWGAVQSDALLGNGLPGIPFGPSSSRKLSRKHDPATKAKRIAKAKKRQALLVPPPNPKSLLSLMNGNIKTMRRVRSTHAKFAALNAATAPPEDEEGAEGGLFGAPVSAPATAFGSRPPPLGSAPGYIPEDDVVDDKIDEAPWTMGRGLGPGTGKDTGKAGKKTGIDIGAHSASDCLHWSSNKILEHAGFQGTSSVALDVLADVTAQFLENVGRTMRFLTDKFARTMSAEEIILHTLFESGSSKVEDLECYISEDVERYGVRLGELEKKLVGAYRETTAGETLEDEGLFDSEGEEETGALAMGDFADILGEDYLGLRELGIAEEFGMSNLSIPKRLLKGKKGQNKPTASKPTEPPPPYPPPPPFVTLTAGKVDEQIGLLKPYYQNRFSLLTAASAPASSASGPSLSGPSLPGPSLAPAGPALPPPPPPPSMMPPPPPPQLGVPPSTTAAPPPPTSSTPVPPPAPAPPPELALPDDPPAPAQVKMGPIGQIVKPGAGAAASKKKVPKGDGAAGGAGASNAAAGPSAGVNANGVANNAVVNGVPVASPKKKKGNTGVGSGNGRKKKPDGPAAGGAPSSMMPVVVYASA